MVITAAIIQSILIIVFLGSGAGKVLGSRSHVDNFNRLQLPQWFRVVTGTVQLSGAAGLAIGYFYSLWATIAGIWLALTMLGAIWAHVRIKDRFKQMAAAIIVFCFTVVYLVSMQIAF